jgi:TonB family protein
MAARNKPYDQFGPYILFKKLESDALGELWRAGRIENGALGPTVALRRLTGGHREAMTANALAVAPILPKISGTSFVREQQAGVIDGVPYLAWEYAGGHSLRDIIDRGRGGKDVPPNPLPIDQAIVIAEKVALSLATMADLRDGSGSRLYHGALIPQFIWISDDGEIRVAGQQLGNGIIASLNDPKSAADVARYFSPEYRASGQPQKNTDVYSIGAILFLLVTGQEPPDAATASAFMAAVRAGKTMTGAPVPDDIRVILDKSFNLDASMRYASIAEMKQAISALGSKYSATTFNLAFYLSNLLKKEIASEAADREKESKVNVAAYVDTQKTPAVPAAVAATAAAAPALATPMFAGVEEPKRSKLPLIAAAVVAVGILGAGAFMMFGKSAAKKPVQQVAAAGTLPPPQPARIISEPIAVSATPQTATSLTTTAAPGSADPEAQKKAFEEAVKQRMHEEMMKLQNDYMAELKQKQSKSAPVVTAPAAEPAVQQTAAAEERPSVSAAQLDQQRRETVAEAPRTVAAPIPAPAQPAVTAPAPVQQAVTVREGDVVDVASLDVLPRITRASKPTYPPLAARQGISATIFLTVLVSENGDVLDVKVLRGDTRFGLNDAAVRAMRGTRFSPAIKDGKRVRTWYPQTIEFKK